MQRPWTSGTREIRLPGEAARHPIDQIVKVAHRLCPGQSHPRREDEVVRLRDRQQRRRPLERHAEADRLGMGCVETTGWLPLLRLRSPLPVWLGCRGSERFRGTAFGLLGRGGVDEAVGRQRAVDSQFEVGVLLTEFIDRRQESLC